MGVLLLTGCQAQRIVSHDGSTSGEVAPPVATAAPMSAVDREDAANAEMRRRMEKRVALERDQIGLAKVIEFIRDTTGAPIAVDWVTLELVGVEPDSLVTIDLKNVPASYFLELTLEQVTPEIYDAKDGPTFVVRDGVVIVSTVRALAQDVELRQYSLDPFASARPTINQRLYADNNAARRMLGMVTLQGKDVDPQKLDARDLHAGFCATCDASRKHDRLDVALTVMTYQEQVDQVMELIQTSVGDPDEWLDEESTMTEIGGSLLIKTTPENHAKIRGLFESMRIERAERFKRQALEMETLLLLEQAEAYRLKQDYSAALEAIEQALRVDPHSLEARALYDIVAATLSR
jgi:hypothetical protein